MDLRYGLYHTERSHWTLESQRLSAWSIGAGCTAECLKVFESVLKCLKPPESVIKWNKLYCSCFLLTLLRIHGGIFQNDLTIEQYRSRTGSHDNFVKTKDISSRFKDRFWSLMLLMFHLNVFHLPVLKQLVSILFLHLISLSPWKILVYK